MTTAPLSLEHLLRPAATTSEKSPVLFMFHGYGSNEEDLFSFAPELSPELCIISVRAPYALQPFGFAWYAIHFDAPLGKWSDDTQAVASRDLIVGFIEEACVAYGLDTERVSLLGFSQGTILSLAVGISYPEKVKNIVALSGYVNENILLDGYRSKDHSRLEVYASHGMVDQVIPLEWAQKTPEFLNSLGVDCTYKEFPVGHGVSPQNFAGFKTWLEARI